MSDIKKGKRTQTTMMDLSSELVEEILLRVPAKSLTLMKLTCKQCKTLIEDPNFADKHFTSSRGREQQFTVVTDVPPADSSSSGSKVSCVSIDFDRLKKPCLNVNVFVPGYLVDHVFECDGLLVWVMRNDLLILNPLLRRGKLIKSVPVPPRYGYHPGEHAYGLGYVTNPSRTSSSDYKIVKFTCDTIIKFDIWVFDFKSDSWRQVFDKSFDGFFNFPMSSVCLRGTPYWIGISKRGTTIYSIQSFNFARECFEPLFLPPTSFEWGDSLSLAVFRGEHISLLHQSCFTGNIHLWVKKQEWNMMMTVVIPELTMFYIYSSYLIGNNGKLVICGRHFETKFVTIYIAGENEEFQKVEYRNGNNSIVGGCYYVPSLLKVPGFSG